MDKIITDEAFLIKHTFDLYMKDYSLEKNKNSCHYRDIFIHVT